ncbi:MAG: winged helix-turn-helix domain-containing protein, partial [Candidatus Bathyarchaeota archaeon]|nr:winged helix-turn-helix domain-containing protein [Candidatus Bathyarchaeota archaeon]
MPRRRRLGTRVLKAVSSSIRLQVLTLLLEKGALSYTEIMNILRLNPSRDAGRFAYHLKSLLKADLIEPDVKTKKYRLTDLGRMLVDVAENIEERFFKRRKMMVRTSRFAMEEFDRNKIAESL